MVRGYNLFMVAVALSMPSLAMAQTMSFGDSAGLIASSCGADITANCRGVNLDSNRLKECLSRNQDVVSAQCKATYFKAFEAIQKRISARVTVANACQREIVKLCGGSTKETSKSIPCLLTANGVSARCQQAMGEAGYR
ncbi:Conserved hypothetical protein; putative signal peptide [Bradyrhizobium sp. ORS 278]|uniref:hypothetical protein n=1 Tax=Bradyrhizobium sp. (strain ORS 278) TaxID=114615 RepID=UPI0001508CD1|nr:hypothetical protein [Bradyrhizobium sp. ORS 278]CAL79291.1 Conserved hypothetical protein; putative signal peptide [Bradyrhizobium sp. ORS 278]